MILTRSTRISQPQGQVELDRTNPLLLGSGAGVEFCFLPGSNFDPASRNTWAKNSGSDVIRRFGRAVSFAGAVGNAYTQTTNLTSQEKVTLIAVIERDGASPYACVLATSSSNSAFRMEFAGNGSDLALVKGGVVELPSINIPAGVPHVVVTSHNQLTGEYYIVASPLYGGNKLRAAGTNTQSSIPSDGTLSINRNGGANTFNGSVGLLCGVFDFLSESVAHKILDNPWQLFRPAQRRIYFDMGAGGGATSVASDLTAGYAIQGAVSSDAAASYSIRGGVSAQLDAQYDIRISAFANIGASYDIRGPVSADVAGSYTIRGAASSDSAASYDIRGAAYAATSPAYDIRGPVNADLSASYEILSASSVTADSTCAYPILGSVGSSSSTSYGIRGAVASDRSSGYAIRGTVLVDLSTSYAIEAGMSSVYADLSTSYAIEGPVFGGGLSPADITAIRSAVRTELTPELAAIFQIQTKVDAAL